MTETTVVVASGSVSIDTSCSACDGTGTAGRKRGVAGGFCDPNSRRQAVTRSALSRVERIQKSMSPVVLE